MSFLAEMRRRSVVRIASAYLVAGWLAMQVVDVITDASGLPEWAPSFALILLIVGFPIALIVTWAFELTPQGVQRTEPRTASETIEPFHLFDGLLLGALALVISLIAWQQFAKRSSHMAEGEIDSPPIANPAPVSLAVLAFDDLSPNGDQAYLSEGISEEILNILAGVEGLEVTSHLSAFRFKNSDASATEIASQLNVRHVVEGSLRRAGDSIRVTAQLTDGASQRHVWSDTYDRDLTAQGLFQIQEDIASAIVRALSEELDIVLPGVEVQPATENLTAYELFLRARPLFNERRDFSEAQAYLVDALSLDPGFAEAWEMRGAMEFISAVGVAMNGEWDARLEQAEEYLARALELKPDSSLAIATLAYINAGPQGQQSVERLASQIEDYTRALSIDPHNTTALNWRGTVYANIGQLQLAIDDFAYCVDLEPYYVSCHLNLVSLLAISGNDQAAYNALIAHTDLGLAVRAPPLPMLARLGKLDLFLAFAAEVFGTDAPWGNHTTLYEMYRNPGGDWEHLIDEIAAFESGTQRPGPWRPIDVMIGNFDRIETATGVPFGPEMAEFRQSEGFQRLLNRTSLPEYWRAHGFPPQCRERNDGLISCD